LNTRQLRIALVLVGCVLISILGIHLVSAQPRVVEVPRADLVRFQLVGIEPIAGPDGRALVNDWSVLLFKDRKAGQCYLAFTRGTAMAVTEPAPCPEITSDR
jgi:hypothetical protein